MHIPDGMLSNATVATSGVAAAGFVGVAVRWVRRHFPSERVVLMAVMAALVFALQMLNFPVAGGTSGHFGGGAAAAILLGPWPAVVVMTTVLLVQALLFADGGVLALGANVLNIAVIAPFLGYVVWRMIGGAKASGTRRLAAAFASGWCAVVASALAAAFELWASGRAPLGLVMGAMGFWHALIGIGEGLITAGLIGYLAKVRPDLLGEVREQQTRPLGAVAASLGAIALVAAALSFIASAKPDGLEFVYANLGTPAPASTLLASPLPNYVVPGISNGMLAGVLAGVTGVLLTGAFLWGALGITLRRRGARPAGAETTSVHGHAHTHERADGSVEHVHPHHHAAETDADTRAHADAQERAHEHAHTMGFERFTYLVSPVHALDPRAKVVAVLVFVFGVVLEPPPHAVEFAALAIGLLAVTRLARLPLTALLARSALVLPVAGGIALFAPLAGMSGSWSPGALEATYASGWPVAWAIVAKAWLCAYAVMLLSATTTPSRLFKALKALRFPGVVLTLLTFLYRYADVLGESVRSMRRAIASRAPALGARRQIVLYGNLAGNLFVRAYERGERIHAAMLSRGYDGTLPTTDTLQLRPADALPVLIAVLAVSATLLT